MDNVKGDAYYASKSIENISVIKKYIKNKSYEEFISDGELVDAIMFRLVQLIENINKMSAEFKDKNYHIPWGDILGFRNGIVHEYGETDYRIVYETIINDLDDLYDVFIEQID